MHGLNEGWEVHDSFKLYVENATGLPVHLIDAYNWKDSLFYSMEEQVLGTLDIVKKIAAQVRVGCSSAKLLSRFPSFFTTRVVITCHTPY